MLISSFLKKKKLLIVAVVFFPGTFFGMKNCSNRYLIFKQAEGFSLENIQTGIDFNGCKIKNSSDFEDSRWNYLTTDNFNNHVTKVPIVQSSATEQRLKYTLQKSQEDKKNSVTELELSPSQVAETRKALFFINKAIINQSEKRPTYYDLSFADAERPTYYDLSLDDDELMGTNEPDSIIGDMLPVLNEEQLYNSHSSIDIFNR